MTNLQRFLSSLFLAGALVAPMAVYPSPQDRDDHDRNQADQHQDQDRDHHDNRYYDQDRHEYHNWNAGEQQRYEGWQKDHREYANRSFSQLNHEQQQQYWNWRNEHEGNQNQNHDRNRDQDDQNRPH
jgi:hypothetical protein